MGSKSDSKLTRAKCWFLRYCETINRLARSRGDDFSPKAWAELRACKYAKLSEKIHDNKDYKCTHEEIEMILDFYDKLAKLYSNRKDSNISKENYLEQLCLYRLNKLIEQYPTQELVVPNVVPEIRKEETKTMLDEIKFLGTVSIAEALDAFSKLDFEHPTTINLDELVEKGFIFVNNDSISVFNDKTMFAENGDCLLSKEEWDQAFAYEKKIVLIPGQIHLLNALKRKSALLSKRKELSQKFSSLLTEEERTNCRFEIQEIDRELDSMCQVW